MTDTYIVKCRYRQVRFYRERDEADCDLETTIRWLLGAQFDQPIQVIALNTDEGWSRDASEDVARELLRRARLGDIELSDGVKHFIQRQGLMEFA